jgi:hypothetical protein
MTSPTKNILVGPGRQFSPIRLEQHRRKPDGEALPLVPVICPLAGIVPVAAEPEKIEVEHLAHGVVAEQVIKAEKQ